MLGLRAHFKVFPLHNLPSQITTALSRRITDRRLAPPIHSTFFLFRLQWFSSNSLRSWVYSTSYGCGNSYLKIPFRHLHSRPRGRFKQDQKPTAESRRKGRKSTPESVDVDKKTVYTRDTVLKIHNILKYSTWASAQNELRNLPMKWESYMVNQVLKTHPPMEKAWLFFNWAAGVRGFKHDRFTCTTMLDIFGEAGRVSSMMLVFDRMREKGMEIDAVTRTSLMHWLSESGDFDGAARVWEEMRSDGRGPTVVSYTAYMKIMFSHGRESEATEAYKEMLRSGLTPNCHTYTVLMDFLVGTGKCKEALEIFGKMQEAKVYPDKAACNILVEKLSKSGETRAMSEILNYMKENRIVLRYPVFLGALEALKASGENVLLLREVNRHCSIESPSKDSTKIAKKSDKSFTADKELVLSLARKESLIALERLLIGIAEKDTKLDPTIVSTIIDANCGRGRLERAIWAFEYGAKNGVEISRTSCLALLGALTRSDSFPKIVGVLEEMIKARHCIGIYLSSVLIYNLGRAQKPKLASRVFNMLPHDHKCTSTYSALVDAYFFVGNFDKGLEIFRTMQSKGVVPCLGTYNLVFSGLSRSSRVSEAKDFRKRMKRFQIDHGRSTNSTSFGEKICDLLFVGDMIS